MVEMRAIQAAIERPAVWEWRSGIFWLRLFLSLVLVPPLSSALAAPSSGVNWLSGVLMLGLVGTWFMVVIGMPLVIVFSLLRITGFLPFSIAGGVCATIAANPWGHFDISPPLFNIGAIAGYLFRLMLFGFKRS